MAYNNGFPINYPQYNNMPLPGQGMGQSFPQQMQQGYQSQQSGFIPVPSEEVARNYPVGPGNSVTFKNENAPYIYTKTMGFSQLDRPLFEKYKLVREDDTPAEAQAPSEPSKEIETVNAAIDNIKADVDNINVDFDNIKAQIDAMKADIDTLKEQIKQRPAYSRKKDES